MFTEDPRVFLRDFGIPCVANGADFAALLDQPDQLLSMGGGRVQSTEWALTVLATDVAAAGLANGVAMTVDGSPAVIRDVLALDDGVFYRVIFSR